jgi:hypothetical protein
MLVFGLPYFATERGRLGCDKYRLDFAKLIGTIASPNGASTMPRSIAPQRQPRSRRHRIHNYPWRLGLAEGEPEYYDLENRLAEGPVIGRSFTLRINYRTSHQVRVQADRLLPASVSNVDGNSESRKGTISVFDGPPPQIVACKKVQLKLCDS